MDPQEELKPIAPTLSALRQHLEMLID